MMRKQASYQTPFGKLEGSKLMAAESLYLYFYDMVNDGMRNDYANGRLLYADPMDYLDRMKTSERADIIYAPETEDKIT